MPDAAVDDWKLSPLGCIYNKIKDNAPEVVSRIER